MFLMQIKKIKSFDELNKMTIDILQNANLFSHISRVQQECKYGFHFSLNLRRPIQRH